MQFYTGDYNPIIPKPSIEIYISGIKQEEVLLSNLTETIGLEPGNCTLLYPMRLYGAHPCSLGNSVSIYINRRIRPSAMFIGFVVGFDDIISLSAGQYVQVQCVDKSAYLQWEVAERNYNQKDSLKNLSEELTIRQIVNLLYLTLTDRFGNSAPVIQIADFPIDYPGEVSIMEQPIHQALMNLLEFADGKYYLRKYYTQGEMFISCFKTGTGTIKDIIYGTDRTLSIYNQKGGVANVNEVRKQITATKITNRGILNGNSYVETAFLLSPAWDSTKEDYLLDLDIYTKKGKDDDPNEDYDEAAKQLGTLYELPEVNTGLFAEVPKIESKNITSTWFTIDGAKTYYSEPYVIYKYSSEPTVWYVSNDVQVQDNYVRLSKPLYKYTYLEDGTVDDYELPATVYLEGTYISRLPFQVERNISSDMPIDMVRYYKDDSFFKKTKTNYFTVALTNGELIGTYHAATVVVADDTADAQTYLDNQLAKTADVEYSVEYTLPRFDLSYELGDRIRENGVIQDYNIVGIEYDCLQYVTKLLCSNRG